MLDSKAMCRAIELNIDVEPVDVDADDLRQEKLTMIRDTYVF